MAHAKGDLEVGKNSTGVGVVTVGSDTQILTADSSQTLGVKWGAAGLVSAISPNSSPGRALDSTFTPSSTRPTLVMYTIEHTVALTATGTSDSQVELRSDSAGTPTTVRCSSRKLNTSTLALVGITSIDRQVLTYLVPANDNVRLVSSGSGTHTETLIQQTEIIL